MCSPVVRFWGISQVEVGKRSGGPRPVLAAGQRAAFRGRGRWIQRVQPPVRFPLASGFQGTWVLRPAASKLATVSFSQPPIIVLPSVSATRSSFPAHLAFRDSIAAQTLPNLFRLDLSHSLPASSCLGPYPAPPRPLFSPVFASTTSQPLRSCARPLCFASGPDDP